MQVALIERFDGGLLRIVHTESCQAARPDLEIIQC